MFDKNDDNEFDDLRSLRDERADDEDIDALFGDYSAEPVPRADDPFASLDEADEDDLFSQLQTEEEDPFSSLREEGEEVEAVYEDDYDDLAALREESLPPLPEAAVPDWLSELGIESEDIVEERGSVVVAERDRVSAPAPAASTGGMALGMTAQQRMVLAIFLFLDIAVLGFLLLYAMGAIQL
ncbi:MAG TPA: hypothetical protein VKY39_09810 [Aggregatilineales bacterium]|nr:hypothetical protein [Aggregatilineales bacterium]